MLRIIKLLKEDNHELKNAFRLKEIQSILIKITKTTFKNGFATIDFKHLKIVKNSLKGIVLKSKKIFLDKIKCIKFVNKNKIFISIK